MCYPIQNLAHLQIYGSYWNPFFRELQLIKKNEETMMCNEGFVIFLNIENRCVLQCHTTKSPDYMTKHATNKRDTDSKHRKRKGVSDEEKDVANIKGYAFCTFYKLLQLFWAVTRITTTRLSKH